MSAESCGGGSLDGLGDAWHAHIIDGETYGDSSEREAFESGFQAARELAAKAEANPSTKPWKPKRAPLWMTVARGGVYRLSMRAMHRLGWCYPERTLVNETGVWCHWCGMRGSLARAVTTEDGA